MNIKKSCWHIKEDIIENDSVAVIWNWINFINEWIIKENTKLIVWKLLNIWWINFPIKNIFYAMPGLHYVDTEYWNYSIKVADRNNWEQFKYYEENKNN
jgi:hypothetical protein